MEINNAKKSGPSKITKADITSNFKLEEQEGPNKGKKLIMPNQIGEIFKVLIAGKNIKSHPNENFIKNDIMKL